MRTGDDHHERTIRSGARKTVKSLETKPSAPVVRHLVSDLLKGGREAVLEHDGQDYHLRVTANGRLILTK